MAFHPYPQLIGTLFNVYPSGPPSGVTRTSSWPRVDHPVSRLPPPTRRPLQTRSSPARVTRRFIMQKARRHPHTGAPTACRRTGSGSVSLPCSGFFSPFPHGTGSLSVSREYLALPDGPGRFTRDSSCPALLRIPSAGRVATCKGLSPATAALSRGVPLATRPAHDGPTTPSAPRRRRFGLLRFRSPLLAESLLFSPPVGT